MKRFVRSVAVILTLCVAVVSFSGCSLLMDYTPNFERYQVSDFTDISYSRPDIDRFYTLSDKIKAECGSALKALSVNDYFNEMVDIYYSVYAMISLLTVYTAIDITDKYYQEEYLYLQNEVLALDNEISRISKVLSESECAYMIEYYNGREVWDYFKKSETETSESEAIDELKKKENLFLSEFNGLASKEYVIPAEDVEGWESVSADKFLNEEEVIELYDNGLIDNEKLTELRREIYLLKNAEYGEIYVKLINVRNEIAEKSGYESYSDYAYEKLYARKYDSVQVEEMRNYVKKEFVPLYNSLSLSLDMESLEKGNSFIADAYNNNITNTVAPAFSSIDGKLLDVFEDMFDQGFCDLYYSEKKSDVFFVSYLQMYNRPFLFCSPAKEPTVSDFFGLVHEFGHFYGYSTVPISEFNSSEIDSQEVLSQCFELLVADHCGDVFAENDVANAAYTYVIVELLSSIIEGCKQDEFQERVYELENPTVEEINKIYGSVMYEYGTDFYDAGDGHSLSWVDITHHFIAPFYYISYSASAIASFSIWSCENSEDVYFSFLDNTQSMSFLENLEAVGVDNPFEEETLQKIKDTIVDKTKKLGVKYEV